MSLAGERLDRPPLAIATGPGAQEMPAIGADGSGYLIVWRDSAGIRARGVSSDGSLGEEQIVTNGTGDKHPALAWNGTMSLVAYESDGDVHALGLDKSGVVIIGPERTVMNTPDLETFPQVASDGDGSLVVLKVQKPSGQESDIYARLFRDRLGSRGLCFPIATTESVESSPVVSFLGGKYLVVWTRENPPGVVLHPENESDFVSAPYHTNVTTSADVFTPHGTPTSSTYPFRITSLALAQDGNRYLIVQLE